METAANSRWVLSSQRINRTNTCWQATASDHFLFSRSVYTIQILSCKTTGQGWSNWSAAQSNIGQSSHYSYLHFIANNSKSICPLSLLYVLSFTWTVFIVSHVPTVILLRSPKAIKLYHTNLLFPCHFTRAPGGFEDHLPSNQTALTSDGRPKLTHTSQGLFIRLHKSVLELSARPSFNQSRQHHIKHTRWKTPTRCQSMHCFVFDAKEENSIGHMYGESVSKYCLSLLIQSWWNTVYTVSISLFW